MARSISVAATLCCLLVATLASAASSSSSRFDIDARPFIDHTRADCGLQLAIDQAAQDGGGTVRIPPGVFQLRRGLVLRDRVAIVGSGMGKTILTPARRVQRTEILEFDSPGGSVTVSQVPAELEVGSAVVVCECYPYAPYLRDIPRPCYVKAIDRDARRLTLAAPYGFPLIVPGLACLIHGDAAALAHGVAKGDGQIMLTSANAFQAGDEVTLGAPENDSMPYHAFVRQVVDDTIVLEEPAKVDFEAWPAEEKIGGTKINALVWGVFPLLHAANLKSASISDLTLRGRSFQYAGTTQNRHTVSAIHLFNAKHVRIRRVAIHDWPADGISLQAGDRCRVVDCEITGALQNGLHPGTGLTNSIFERNVLKNNGAGLYFCWDNVGHVIRGNQFIENLGGGITGLGNPRERNNLIENNIIAGNGTYGIEINGGGKSGNVIRGNLIENNSRSEPGKYAGILISSSGDGAAGYQIIGNTIRDTQPHPTQHVGVEELEGGDENVVVDNRFAGHSGADIITSGRRTVAAPNGSAKVVHQPAAR